MSEQGKDAERLAPTATDADRMEAGAEMDALGEPRIYPCHKCGTMRSKAEGGTTFTVCDSCWDEEHPPKEVTYRIVNVWDFLEVPEDRLPLCLEEFADALKVARAATQLLGERWDIGAYSWVDDGQRGATLRFSVEATARATPKSEKPKSEASEPAPEAAHTDQGAR